MCHRHSGLSTYRLNSPSQADEHLAYAFLVICTLCTIPIRLHTPYYPSPMSTLTVMEIPTPQTLQRWPTNPGAQMCHLKIFSVQNRGPCCKLLLLGTHQRSFGPPCRLYLTEISAEDIAVGGDLFCREPKLGSSFTGH